MNARKPPTPSWRRHYTLHRNVAIVLALLLVIAAFRVNVHATPPIEQPEEPDPPIRMVDLPPPTNQTATPPAPPRPTVPYLAPDYEIIDDPAEFVDDLPVDPDPSEPAEGTPPPPEPDAGEREESFFEVVEEMPELIGGQEALYDAVTYPAFARRAGIEGRVFVRFVVDETGRVRDAEVVKGVHPLLNKEALRAVEAMTFEPGKQRGKPVPVRMTLPIVFTIR